jgi:hypothetical protein
MVNERQKVFLCTLFDRFTGSENTRTRRLITKKSSGVGLLARRNKSFVTFGEIAEATQSRFETTSMLLPASVNENFCGVLPQTTSSFAHNHSLWNEASKVETGVEETTKEIIFKQPYPNPCGDETMISLQLPHSQNIKLTLLDALGREVVRVAEGHYQAGNHQFIVVTKSIPAGIYYVRLHTLDAVFVHTLVHF